MKEVTERAVMPSGMVHGVHTAGGAHPPPGLWLSQKDCTGGPQYPSSHVKYAAKGIVLVLFVNCDVAPVGWGITHELQVREDGRGAHSGSADVESQKDVTVAPNVMNAHANVTDALPLFTVSTETMAASDGSNDGPPPHAAQDVMN